MPRPIRVLGVCVGVLVVLGLGILIGRGLYSFSGAQHLKDLQLQAFRDDIREAEYVKYSLMVAYSLSDPEAEFYGYWFRKGARKYVMPWELFAALAKVESNFDPTACSEKEAIGVLQILEPTLEVQCKKLHIQYRKGRTGWTDVLNVVAGMSYIAEGKDSTDSTYQKAIRSYIGGTNYARALKGGETEARIEAYYQKVWAEYRRLLYLHAGVKAKGILWK